MARTGLQSACPQCGAPLHFGSGHSLISVCEFCRSAVARADAELSTLGRMPDLVATDTRLALGANGKLGQQSFTVLGRAQLHQGQARWDEWYVSWDDGSYGWLAEAQARLIVTKRFEHPLTVPPLAAFTPGQRIELPELGTTITVEEIGQARLLSAQGELPYWPKLDSTYRFVDASMPDSGYITLDFGTVGDAAEAFVGRQLTYEEAGLGDFAPPFHKSEVRGRALQCPQCGAPLALKSEQTKSIVCDSCRALCGLEDGKLALLRALRDRPDPPLKLGSRGKLQGRELEVIGWVLRRCVVDDEEFTWSEYLLHGESGYHWLSEGQGHWVFLTPMAAARALTNAQRYVTIDERVYEHFSTSRGVTYASMQGEFYWQLDPEQPVQMDDYVAPPYMASRELVESEVNWTLGVALSPAEVWSALGQQGPPPPARGIGPCQPNPHVDSAKRMRRVAAIALAVVCLLALVMGITTPRKLVLTMDVPLSSSTPVAISEPFEITGATRALELSAYAPRLARRDWVGLDVSLVDERSGRSQPIALELSGTSHASATLGSVSSGRYVLRVEPQAQPSDVLTQGNVVQVRAMHGVFLWFPLIMAVGLLVVPAWFASLRRRAFEARRWANSDHPRLTFGSS